MRIMIGTQNPAKQKEFIRIISQINKKIKILFPQDFNIIDEPFEKGITYYQNALIKARFYYEKTHIPTIADDGGFEIDLLNNEPGIKSKRWLGENLNDEKIITHTIKVMQRFKTQKQRRARLVVCLVYYSDKIIVKQTEFICGYVARLPSNARIQGFPYRSLFKVTGLDKYYDELTEKEHEKYNHRQCAMTKLLNKVYFKDND